MTATLIRERIGYAYYLNVLFNRIDDCSKVDIGSNGGEIAEAYGLSGTTEFVTEVLSRMALGEQVTQEEMNTCHALINMDVAA